MNGHINNAHKWIVPFVLLVSPLSINFQYRIFFFFLILYYYKSYLYLTLFYYMCCVFVYYKGSINVIVNYV